MAATYDYLNLCNGIHFTMESRLCFLISMFTRLKPKYLIKNNNSVRGWQNIPIIMKVKWHLDRSVDR